MKYYITLIPVAYTYHIIAVVYWYDSKVASTTLDMQQEQ